MVRGLGTREAAEAASVSPSTWRYYEAGAKVGDSIHAIAKLCECDAEQLIRMSTVPCESDVFGAAAREAVADMLTSMA